VTEWESIHRSGGAPIREGMVQKLHQGIFKKWNPRNVSLTRETFCYYADGVLKGKFMLESQIGRPKVAAGYSNSLGVFEIRVGEKDFVLQTNSVHSRNLWMHGVDCALNKVFASPPPFAPPPIRPYSTSSVLVEQDAYLRLGRSAIPKAGSARNLVKNASSSSNELGLYKMLSLCKVNATHGPDNLIPMDGVKDPSTIVPALIEYDFMLEERVLST